MSTTNRVYFVGLAVTVAASAILGFLGLGGQLWPGPPRDGLNGLAQSVVFGCAAFTFLFSVVRAMIARNKRIEGGLIVAASAAVCVWVGSTHGWPAHAGTWVTLIFWSLVLGTCLVWMVTFFWAAGSERRPDA